ncbi:hypothetical protein BE17_01145 [Sorangium cellulosum]|uniref:Uncharacterized protein n=1 Tax=Sorangium cellulosum TaxID=56 RepID=A0A150SG96_SORCE|nr:hypothetical protein BE17_01145 [Sorangium cellulosum]
MASCQLARGSVRRGHETPCTCGFFLRENREIRESPPADGAAGRIGKAGGRTSMMHDSRKSDRPVVPTKPSNNAEPSAAEGVEGRGMAKGNTDEQNAPRTQSRIEGVPSALDRVRQRARQNRKTKFTALFHLVTVDRLRDAYLSLQRRAAPGVDGVTWEQYGENLETNLLDLHARIHREKWLSAGVMEEGRWTAGEQGSPQGATVSPLLANI